MIKNHYNIVMNWFSYNLPIHQTCPLMLPLCTVNQLLCLVQQSKGPPGTGIKPQSCAQTRNLAQSQTNIINEAG